MAKLTATTTASTGHPGASPAAPVALAAGTPTSSTGTIAPPQLPNNNQRYHGLGSVSDVRQELADAHADMETFFNLEPDEVIRLVAGHSARLSTIRTAIMQYEVVYREWKPVRAEVENCLDELRQQYQYASRLLFSRELDWKIETGGRIT